MTVMLPEKSVIIDYCGTLSLEAPRFGRPENLVPALDRSGLAALGVSTPEIFWEKLVDPTWDKGSTTSIGYARVMAERIAALGLAPDAPIRDIGAATARFVALYLAASRIDPGWRPVLQRLSEVPTVMTVIATDHYAEATEKIIGYLGSWGIDAKNAGKTMAPPPPPAPRFFVANSADIGAWKACPRFWENLKSRLPWASVRRILLIDDFGGNEAPGDSYGEREKVRVRQEKTLACLGESFRALLEVTPFHLIQEGAGSEEAAAGLIEKTAARIGGFLEGT